MKKWLNDYLEETILLILLIAMTTIMGIQIVSRYLFQNSLSWSEELTRFLFIWSAFIGIPYCMKRNSSIKIENLKNSMPPGIQKIMMTLDKVFLIALYTILLVFGSKVVNATMLSGQTSAAMGLPMWVVQLAVPVAAFLAIIRTLQRLKNVLDGTEKVVTIEEATEELIKEVIG